MNILLHDDWEINGDGTGNPVELMFAPARKLLAVCDRHGARYTFFAEVMQQFAMIESSHARHREWAAEWEEILRDAVRRGHDVQLHLHPQWIGSSFERGRWRLDYTKWSAASLPEEEIYHWLARGKTYLEHLLQPVSRDYQTVAFRAGGWMAQPSGALIRAMRRAGLIADCSVVPGKYIAYRDHGEIDFRETADRLLPWWTAEDDVAKAGSPGTGVIEIPTFAETCRVPLAVHLLRDRPAALLHYLAVGARKRRHDRARTFVPAIRPADDRRRSIRDRFFAERATYCSFGYMHHRTLLRMARAACKAARRRGIEETPLILLTHSKSFYAFGNFDRFLGRLAREPGMTFSRTRDCVVRLGQNALPRLPLQREARANAFGTHAAGAAAV